MQLCTNYVLVLRVKWGQTHGMLGIVTISQYTHFFYKKRLIRTLGSECQNLRKVLEFLENKKQETTEPL